VDDYAKLRERWKNHPDGMTVAEVALDETRPYEDRRWLLLWGGHAFDDQDLRLLACLFAERALLNKRGSGREPDIQSWNSVRVARLFAVGEATEEERRAASASASASAYAAYLSESQAQMEIVARLAEGGRREIMAWRDEQGEKK